jgi:hypothetical protein
LKDLDYSRRRKLGLASSSDQEFLVTIRLEGQLIFMPWMAWDSMSGNGGGTLPIDALQISLMLIIGARE